MFRRSRKQAPSGSSQGETHAETYLALRSSALGAGSSGLIPIRPDHPVGGLVLGPNPHDAVPRDCRRSRGHLSDPSGVTWVKVDRRGPHRTHIFLNRTKATAAPSPPGA